MNATKISNLIFLLLLGFFPTPGFAPFPPCSPLTFINKLVESSNLSSDLHPYYPVPPCQYRGGTLEALAKNDLEAVFIQDIPRHIAYEAAWAAGTGIPRLMKVLHGNFEVKIDKNILSEIISARRHSRHHKFGHNKVRDPSLFDDDESCNQEIQKNLRTARMGIQSLLAKF